MEAARLHRARYRREKGLTLVEGPHLIADAVAAGAVVREVYGVDPVDSGVIPVDHRALERLAGTETPRGPIAVVEIAVEWMDPERNLLVSVGVSDPGNVGTMIRTAASFGWGFAYMEGSADPWAPKTIRAGAGGQFQTPVSKIASLREAAGWTLVAAVPSGGEPPSEIAERPVALLIGEEAHGLPDWAITAASRRLTIPTSGTTDSLNAGVAAGIVVYELTRKGSGEAGGDV